MNAVDMVRFVISSKVIDDDEKAQFIAHPTFAKILSAQAVAADQYAVPPQPQSPLETYKAWLIEEVANAKVGDRIQFITQEYIKSENIRTWVTEYIAGNNSLGILKIGNEKYITIL